MQLGVKEKIFIALCDDELLSECPSIINEITGIEKEEAERFLEEALKEGYLELVELPNNGKNEEWVYYTSKISRNELDDDALVLKTINLFDETTIKAAKHNIKEKLGQ